MIKNHDDNIKPLTKEEMEDLTQKANFQKRVDKLAKKYKNKRVVIYGGGLLFSLITNNYDLSKLNIVAIADKSVRDEGQTIENFKAVQ